MSSSNRTTSRGGKGAKGDTSKAHKHDKSDTGKGAGDKSSHSGGSDNARSKSDDPSMKEKVRQVMEMTRRSEEEVCLALHECDYDTEHAINMLYENIVEGEWETSSKKKKNRQASASKADVQEAATTDEWSETPPQVADKEKPRNKSGGPPRLHGRHNDSRGWRGRENKENERNLEDGGNSERRERRGRPGGPTRGGSGRGRGGGRAGARYPPRNNRGSSNFSGSRTIDTWENTNTWESTTITNSSHVNHAGKEENWDDFPATDDWSTEEYTGSLADTKVFTPSVQQQQQQMQQLQQQQQQLIEAGADPAMVSASVPLDGSGLTTGQLAQSMDMRNQLPPQPQMTSQSPVQIMGTLNAAQTQYLSQLTQQSESMKAAQYGSSSGHPPSQTYGSTAGQPYNSGQTYNSTTAGQQYSNAQQYGTTPPANTYSSSNYVAVNSNYGHTPEATATAQQPARTKTQRARVPPPSKIPASAVEMPGDLNSSIGYLDVQFGAMDFMSDGNSFDGDAKYGPSSDATLNNSSATPSSNLDLNQGAQNAIDAYSTNKPQSSISSALSQSLTNTDTIPQTSEHLPGSYNSAPRSSASATSAASSATQSSLDLKSQNDSHSYSQSSTYNSYQPKTTSYQAQNYTSSNYIAPQTTSSSYQANNSYANSNAGSYNTPSGGNAYQNYSSSSSYQNNSAATSFPSISQANSYPANNQAYQQNASQSVYGANSGLSNSSNYGNTASSSNQYNSYGTGNKLSKEATYDNSATSVSTATTTSSVSTTSSALSLSQTTATVTKATTTLTKNASSAMSNIPPGVTPVMNTAPYIMGQGIPYFQQPIYSYEDMQMLQQRIPHVTGYYDLGYQTPTTLAAVRDGTLASVAYSISDGRYTRGDNNTSPVPSTLSQQTSTLTQGHQAQPMLAQTAGPAPFFYTATAYNPMQPAYQFGAVYPQIPAVTNAHGSNNSSQYPKPATYGSSYGSGYDALTQSQDYSKSGYVGNTQGQSKGSGGNASLTGSTGNDLSAYGKSHTALGKVNSYEKQGFHSGTPPPFTGALHGNQNAGLAPSGTGYGPQMYIPTMAPHQQHHSTQLMHQPLHPDSGNSGGQRSQGSNQAKSGNKQGYPTSYWNQA